MNTKLTIAIVVIFALGIGAWMFMRGRSGSTTQSAGAADVQAGGPGWNLETLKTGGEIVGKLGKLFGDYFASEPGTLYNTDGSVA